jgi:hypothetical protein
MAIALTSALLFTGSRDNWMSLGLGLTTGVAFVLLSKRFRRKEDR